MFDFYNSKSYTFRGDFMVTVNNFSKMLAMDEDEVREHISHIANSHFLRTAGPYFPDSPGHIKRTAWDISRAEGTPPY